jgi:hypothetical protein
MMGEADFTELDDDLDAASLARGVTTGEARPNGGGSFCFGFNSKVITEGAAGYFTNQSNFAPTPANKGGKVTGAIKRGTSAGLTGFAPFFFLLGQGNSVNDEAYILGLQDDNPHRIALRKGSLVTGIPSASPGASGILRRSTATIAANTWLHLRIDAVVNLNGDVIIKVFQNDLGVHAVTLPTWTPITGIEDTDLVASHGAGTAFVDDTLGVNSGSAPFTSGYMGFGFFTSDISRRGYYDQITCERQV